MKISVVWDLTPCSRLKINGRFEGIYLHLKDGDYDCYRLHAGFMLGLFFLEGNICWLSVAHTVLFLRRYGSKLPLTIFYITVAHRPIAKRCHIVISLLSQQLLSNKSMVGDRLPLFYKITFHHLAIKYILNIRLLFYSLKHEKFKEAKMVNRSFYEVTHSCKDNRVCNKSSVKILTVFLYPLS